MCVGDLNILSNWYHIKSNCNDSIFDKNKVRLILTCFKLIIVTFSQVWLSNPLSFSCFLNLSAVFHELHSSASPHPLSPLLLSWIRTLDKTYYIFHIKLQRMNTRIKLLWIASPTKQCVLKTCCAIWYVIKTWLNRRKRWREEEEEGDRKEWKNKRKGCGELKRLAKVRGDNCFSFCSIPKPQQELLSSLWRFLLIKS